MDLRDRILKAWQAKEGSQRNLAARFKVSLAFVRDLLRILLQLELRCSHVAQGSTFASTIANFLRDRQVLLIEVDRPLILPRSLYAQEVRSLHLNSAITKLLDP